MYLYTVLLLHDNHVIQTNRSRRATSLSSPHREERATENKTSFTPTEVDSRQNTKTQWDIASFRCITFMLWKENRWQRYWWMWINCWTWGIEERKNPAWVEKGTLSHTKTCPIRLRRFCGGPRALEKRKRFIATGLLSRRTPEYLTSIHVQVCSYTSF